MNFVIASNSESRAPGKRLEHPQAVPRSVYPSNGEDRWIDMNEIDPKLACRGSFSRPWESRDSLVRRRPGPFGRPRPTLELDIRDETGSSVPQGELGEIWVRGEQVSGTYVGRITRRRQGWFPPNDPGGADCDANPYVQGRRRREARCLAAVTQDMP